MRIISKVKSPINAEWRVSRDPAWGQHGWQCHSQGGGGSGSDEVALGAVTCASSVGALGGASRK